MPSEDDDQTCTEPVPSLSWRDAIAHGDAAVLFNDPAVRLVVEATGQDASHGVPLEIGAMRVILARLLTEVTDLEVLAPLAARVVGVSLQAVRLQRSLGTDAAESLIDVVGKILAELELARRG